MLTSYCPDAPAAAGLVLGSSAVKVFYDRDAPMTLAQVEGALPVE